MMMTEDEARGKWCPQVQVVIGPNNSTWQNQAITNRVEFVESGPAQAFCLASACMMWRWDGGRGYCGLVYKRG
jgi:hypothetical protein